MTIDTLLDACELVLREQGEPQCSFWLASQVMEMKLWRASEADVREAINRDIEKLGASSRFVNLPDDEFALRSWPIE
jgi:DNA-directed RNA polymerase delta subunit